MIKTILTYMKHFRQYLSARLFLNFISLITLLGSVAYLSFGLTLPLRIIVLIGAIVLSLYIEKWFFVSAPSNAAKQIPLPLQAKFLIGAYCLLALIGFYLLFQGRSDRPLVTPWETVSAWFFLVYAGATFLLLWLKQQLPPWLLLIHYGLNFSIFLCVYAVGYGFDPYIHEASIKAIENLGKIQPTTIYYLGQYSLVTVFHVIGASVAAWSKLLVPLLAALTFPFALRRSDDMKNFSTIGLYLLIFSFSIFTLTTPQNLAYLFLALGILWSIKADNPGDRLVIWLLAFAALFTQPIAGLPLLLLAASVSAEKLALKNRLLPRLIVLTGFILLLPLAFYFFTPGIHPVIHWPILSQLFSDWQPHNPHSENWWLNFIYLFSSSQVLLYLILAASGGYIAWRNRQQILLTRYIQPALALLVSAVLTMSFDFGYLINYEQNDYPRRLLIVAALFALPLVLLTLQTFIKKLARENRYRRLVWLIFCALLITTSLYLSYPRFDHYNTSRGYATSKADLTAVQWIETAAGSEDYVVLANQQVSAASLRQFGFKKYFNNNIFYYPIPTGGPLYALYLEMIQKPNRATMEKAMALTGTKRAYFVVTEYWWAADKIEDETRQIADGEKNISNDQVLIFKFNK